MIRVVVVDSSAGDRLRAVQALGAADDIAVVGKAGPGEEAVALVRQSRPDVVVLGVDAPRLESEDDLSAGAGYRMVRQLMAHCPTPILLLADPREISGDLVAHMLAAGALDTMERLTSVVGQIQADAARELLVRIRLLSRVPVITHVAGKLQPLAARRSFASPGQRVRGAVAIVSSTGGPMTLARLLSELPGDFPSPVFIVQHIANGFIEGMARWFQSRCNLQVRVAAEGDRAESGLALIGPDGSHITVTPGGSIALVRSPAVGGIRPCGDLLFRSVAAAYGARAIGVVLTGMGNDGALGATCIRQAGGRVIAQDESTSIVFGMPRAAIEAGAADITLPAGAIAEKLVEWVGR